MLAGEYLKRTGDLAAIERLLPNIEAALTWIDEHGDRDGDGFVEYGRLTEEGLINQAWKDSHDPVFHADGTLAKGPTAFAEVQAYVYGGWQAAAEIFRRLGRPERAAKFRAQAEGLRRAFDISFFDEELGTCVLARRRQAPLPGALLERRPCPVYGHRLSGASRPGRPHADERLVLLRLGHPYNRLKRGTL
jgi:glycogen debranching enzyme